MPTRHAALVPILPSTDLDRSLAYYKYLGFDVLEQAKDYVRLAWQGAELHLYPHAGLNPLANSGGCYLAVADPGLLRAAWARDGVECLDLEVPAHCGETLFAVVDPDGNTLRIGPGGTDGYNA
jgi:catechol 2,3-dioxygenase-like lactoylglutathione lyase family enzyme